MKKRKKYCLLLVIFTLLSLFSYTAKALSETQEKGIIKNCKQIRGTLKSIQYTDTDARTSFLPKIYDEALDGFIIPMNTRLLKNDNADKYLTKNQEDFLDAYREFKTDFVTYSRSMEELLKIDCENDPKSFYANLEIVRTDRNYVNLDVEKINQIIEKQKIYVEDLKGEK